MQDILDHIDQNLENSMERLFALLRLKSISTDPHYKTACYDTAKLLKSYLVETGFEVELHDMGLGGHPIILATQQGERDAPHFLFYGHYDVQPVDPVEEWDEAPFEPYVRTIEGEDQIVARGASDDKGQLMTFVEALRAYKEVKGALPCKISLILEGEEESGSVSMVPFLKAQKETLKADLAFICDTNMWDKNTPAITVGLRGLLAQEVVITAANRDLHSGSFGGVAANPLTLLSQILGKLHDAQGRVTLEGFYDNVEDVSQDILAQWRGLSFDESHFLKPIGLSRIAGEQGRLLLENLWSRPTAEINGIMGGYCGEGFKTVIPAKARAKLSFRLVKGQDPIKIRQSFQNFVKSHLPSDCQVQFIDHGASKAAQLPYDNAELLKVKHALSEEWGKDALLVACGGTIPVVGDFMEYVKVNSLMVGFALEEDNIHSPNEKYNIRSFHKGQRSWIRILYKLT